MIPLLITHSPDDRYSCSTDDHHLALSYWLQYDMGEDGGSGAAEEFFEEIGAFRAGSTDHAQAWGDLVRVKVDHEGVVIQLMPSSLGRPCSLSLEELVDATLRWFDVVNPALAGRLRTIQTNW